MTALGVVWPSFFSPHFVLVTGLVDVPVARSFRLLSLRAYAEDLGLFSFSLSSVSSHLYLRHTSLVVDGFHLCLCHLDCTFGQSQGTPCHTV